MIKKWLRNWLGITAQDKRLADIWWDLNDGSGIKEQLKETRQAINTLGEMSAHPKSFKWQDEWLTWKSPNWKTSKKVWLVKTLHQHDYYDILADLSRNDRRETNYRVDKSNHSEDN